jgi:LysM repeat protein
MRLLSFLVIIFFASACTLAPAASSSAEIELTVVVNTPEPLPTTVTETEPPATQATTTLAPTMTATSGTSSSACRPRTDLVTYRVSSGDSLSSIAVRTRSTVAELVEWNCLANANMIVVGMVLQVREQATPPTATFTPTPAFTATFTPSPTSANPPLVTGLVGTLSADPATQNAPNWSEYLVTPGTGVTFMWTGIDPQYYAFVGQVQFFYTADGAAAMSIGIDPDKSDGISITWLIPDGVSGSITARAQYGTSGTIESSTLYLRPR